MRIIVDRREFLSLSLSVPVRDDIMYVIHYYIVLQAIYDRRHIWTQRRNKKELHIRWWLLQLIPVKHLFIRNDDETRERETLDLHNGFSAAFTVAAVVFYVKLHKRQRPKKYIRPDSTFWSAQTDGKDSRVSKAFYSKNKTSLEEFCLSPLWRATRRMLQLKTKN